MSSLTYKNDVLVLQKSSKSPSKNLLYESSIHIVQKKEPDRSSPLSAGSGRSPAGEVDRYKNELNKTSADECEEALLKEQKQASLPPSDKMVDVVDDKGRTTLSEGGNGAGSSSTNDGCNADLKKSLEDQKEEHKT